MGGFNPQTHKYSSKLPWRPMTYWDARAAHDALDIDKELLKAVAIGPDWTTPAFRTSNGQPLTRVRQVKQQGHDAEPLLASDGSHPGRANIVADFPVGKLFDATSKRLQDLIPYAKQIYNRLDREDYDAPGSRTRRAKYRWKKAEQALAALQADKFPFASVYVPCDKRNLLLYFESDRRGAEVTMRWLPRTWYDAPFQDDVTHTAGQIWGGVVDHAEISADGMRGMIAILGPQIRKFCEMLRNPFVRAIFEGDLSILMRGGLAEIIPDPLVREAVTFGIMLIVQGGLNFAVPGSAIAIYAFFQKVCRIAGLAELGASIHDMAVGCVPNTPCYASTGGAEGIQAGTRSWDLVVIACEKPLPVAPTAPLVFVPPKSKSQPQQQQQQQQPQQPQQQPQQQPTPTPTPWHESPTVWIAVGVAVLGAALIMRRSRQPLH